MYRGFWAHRTARMASTNTGCGTNPIRHSDVLRTLRLIRLFYLSGEKRRRLPANSMMQVDETLELMFLREGPAGQA